MNKMLKMINQLKIQKIINNGYTNKNIISKIKEI